MKQLLLLFSVGLMLSCTDTIDQKLSRDSFDDDVKEIKTKYAKEYSEADFVEFREKASNKLTADLLGSGDAKNLTYRAVLDTVKAHRLRDEIELEAYKKTMTKMANDFSLAVAETKFEQDRQHLYLQLRAENNFPKPVTAYIGKIIVTDNVGQKIGDYFIVADEKFSAGEKRVIFNGFSVEKNYSQYANDRFRNLTYLWEPWKISFEDGSVIEKPERPWALIKKDL